MTERAEINAHNRERYATDPVYREKKRAAGRGAWAKFTPEHRAELNRRKRERYKEDPDIRARSIARGIKGNAARRQRQRERVLAAYGGVCTCCGENISIFLAVDHTNGGGNRHRREVVSAARICEWLIKNNFPPDFQLLCHNCNYAESRGGCPHKIRLLPLETGA